MSKYTPQRTFSPCKDIDTYYVWLGGSCDYQSKERFGGGAYVIEFNNQVVSTYQTSDLATTEFRMLLTVMVHSLRHLPSSSKVCFLSNVAYLSNFDSVPSKDATNTDLISACGEAKKQHASVILKLIPYHKYQKLVDTHRLAREAMQDLRQQTHKCNHL